MRRGRGREAAPVRGLMVSFPSQDMYVKGTSERAAGLAESVGQGYRVQIDACQQKDAH